MSRPTNEKYFSDPEVQRQAALYGMPFSVPPGDTVRPQPAGETEPSRVRRRTLAGVQPRSVRFLVPALVPLRALTLFAGVGGLGKSTLALAYAAQLTRGLIGGFGPADAVIVSYEDTADEILRPRLEASGADLERAHALYVEADDGGMVILPKHLGDLELHVEATGARLVIVDPVVASIDLALDAHKDQHVRSVLAQLTGIAERNDCAIVTIGHLNKAPTGDAYLRVANSTAFWNAARSVVLVTEDPDEPAQHRFVTQRKTNWAAFAGVQRHVIESIQLDQIDPATGRPIVTSRIRFVEHATDVNSGDVLNAPAGRKTATATVFLAAALADGDWHDSAGLKSMAAGGQELSDRTLKRAAQQLEVETERRGYPASTWWRLPQSGQGLSPIDGPTVAQLAGPHGYAESDPGRASRANSFGDKDSGPTVDRGRPLRPLIGVPGYPLAVDAAFASGHITEAELRAQLDVDRFVRRMTPAA